MFARISRHGSLGTNGAIAPRTVRDRTGLMAPWHGWSPGTRSSKLRACTRQVGGHKLPLQAGEVARLTSPHVPGGGMTVGMLVVYS